MNFSCINNKKVRDIAVSLKFPPWFLCRFPMIYLENLRGFSLKSSTVLCPLNSPKIPINSAGNLREIPEESMRKFPLTFRVYSRFTYNPNFHVDSPPPSLCHPRGFLAESAWSCPLGNNLYHVTSLDSQYFEHQCQFLIAGYLIPLYHKYQLLWIFMMINC